MISTELQSYSSSVKTCDDIVKRFFFISGHNGKPNVKSVQWVQTVWEACKATCSGRIINERTAKQKKERTTGERWQSGNDGELFGGAINVL